jgi:addiction module HigA family antidote
MVRSRRESFEAFVLVYTGRDMMYHKRYGTTGLDFAWECWQAATKTMERSLTNEFNPDWATHPGLHLAEYMELLDIDIPTLARLTGMRGETVQAVLNGVEPIIEDEAESLAEIFGLKAEIWMRIQRRWDKYQEKNRND